ncbi:MAG: tRNA (adenosine(37)-N6)-threonylcarbamoyltransferase complex dimerization subunit type 1 TsaB [Pseudomonadales bacterium]
MTNILAIDTSGEACSVALSVNGEMQETFEVIPRLHARRLLPMVQAILADSELSLSSLDAIAFGRGPGSFTGLRICAGVAQGLAFGAELPVLPVSSLAALAQGIYRGEGCTHTAVLLDARMNELYAGCYEVVDGIACLHSAMPEELLVAPEQLAQSLAPIQVSRDWKGVGDGWQFASAFPDLARQIRFDNEVVHVHAVDILTLALDAFGKGEQVSADMALPVYLRDKTAWRRIEEQ